MKWTEYRMAADRKANRTEGKRDMTGQSIGPAAPSGEWALDTERKYHRVRTIRGNKFCIATDCPVPAPERGKLK